MRSYFVTGAAASALVLLFAGLAGMSWYQARIDREGTQQLAEAIRVDEVYSAAQTAAKDGESYTQLATATGDPLYLELQKESATTLLTLIGSLADSEHPDDRAFGAWAEQNISPIAFIFAQLRADPPVPYEVVMQEYGAAYGRMYASLEAGGEGIPSGLAAKVVDPASVGGDPLFLVNPITTIMAEKASQKKAEQAAALANVQSAQSSMQIARPLLFAVGGILAIFFVGIIFHFNRREARARADIDQLRRIATTDPLTGLGNRRGFEEASKRLASGVEAGPVAMVMMDLDEFKEVNDTFGHARGDALLTKFAGILAEIAPPGSGRFRIGGDEFALIIRGRESAAVMELAENLRVRAAAALGNAVTVSAGIAMLNPAEPDELLLRQQADAALYEAKLKGRNLVVLYAHDANVAPVFPAAKLHAVRDLLVEGRISSVFQPIWDMDTMNLLGYEALSRPHPDYDLSGPEQAFEIAEQFGHAADLDRLCRSHSLAAAADLPAEGRLFINLSPYSLTHHTYSPLTLLREINAAGMPASRIVFEITEHSKIAPEVIAEAVLALREHGFAVALDDVGSGNNGLEIMRRVAFEYVKVDRSVVLASGKSGTGRAALMAVLAFASESGAIVIAEGIEDMEMFGVVKDVAHAPLRTNRGLIHSVQGYLFGEPLPAELTLRKAPLPLVA